jgi:hypothetical protein
VRRYQLLREQLETRDIRRKMADVRHRLIGVSSLLRATVTRRHGGTARESEPTGSSGTRVRGVMECGSLGHCPGRTDRLAGGPRACHPPSGRTGVRSEDSCRAAGLS